MKWIRARRPSPAMIVALVALFVSLSGVSYGVATGFIDSREIKNNEVRSLDIRNNTIRTRDLRNNEVRGIDIRNSTVQGRDLALNTLTGDDIAESTLGKVPSAAQADSAGSATTAGSVGDVTMRRISYSAEQGAEPVEILNLGGLRLEALCGLGGDLDVRATPAVPNAEIASQVTTPANTVVTEEGFVGSIVDSEGVGQIVFSSAAGGLVTIEALGVEAVDAVRGSTDDCGFFGIARG